MSRLLVQQGGEHDRGAALLRPHVVDLPLTRRYEGKGRGVLSAHELVNSQPPEEETEKVLFLNTPKEDGIEPAGFRNKM